MGRTAQGKGGVMTVKRWMYACVGCIGLGLGALGMVLPMLPTVPFLLMAAFGFARASDRLDRWFKGTKLYRDNLEGYVSGKGMPRKAKIRIMALVTVLMSIGFAMMHQVPAARVVLVCVWLVHVLYFTFGVRERRA